MHPVAHQALEAIADLPIRTTPAVRAVRRRLSSEVRDESPVEVLAVARALIDAGWRWVGYELIRNHRATLESLHLSEVESLGQGFRSWGEVDAFGIYIAGPAWLNAQIVDRDVMRWTKHADKWWRRAALVATVPLNSKAHGGAGNSQATVKILAALLDDRDPIVVKAMSWALRSLVVAERDAAIRFLEEHEDRLAAAVRRETRNKLSVGTKTRRRTSAPS
jgi:3-methyladenine DNA glycosylase AlkD